MRRLRGRGNDLMLDYNCSSLVNPVGKGQSGEWGETPLKSGVVTLTAEKELSRARSTSFVAHALNVEGSPFEYPMSLVKSLRR